jgi:chaperonin GroEL (HSP60 family)
VIRGEKKKIIDEDERYINDDICVLKENVRENNVVYGGG